MLEGFYKVRFQVDEAVGRSVMYAHDGVMLGGNSAFAHYGNFEEVDGVVVSEITSHRHNEDRTYKSLLGSDVSKLNIRGTAEGDDYHFVGSSPQMPAALFRAVLSPIEEIMPETGAVGEGGVVDGLYSVHIRLLDGIDGGLTGVMLLKDGRILGGDAFFYYLGTYTSADGRWKGQILNQEHTPARGEYPIFGGYEVGIGFSGTCDQQGASLEATALAGKRSLRLTAVLKLMCRS